MTEEQKQRIEQAMADLRQAMEAYVVTFAKHRKLRRKTDKLQATFDGLAFLDDPGWKESARKCGEAYEDRTAADKKVDHCYLLLKALMALVVSPVVAQFLTTREPEASGTTRVEVTGTEDLPFSEPPLKE